MSNNNEDIEQVPSAKLLRIIFQSNFSKTEITLEYNKFIDM